MASKQRAGAKQTMDDFNRLSLRGWQRKGWLTPGQTRMVSWSRWGKPLGNMLVHVLAGRLMLQMRGANGEARYQAIPLATTSCNLGGERLWLQCPAGGCQRRVAALYQGRYGRFLCRHCLNLTYASQREAWYDRAHRKAEHIRHKLGWELGIGRPKGAKPPHMRYRTFARWVLRYDLLVSDGYLGLAARYPR